MLITEATITRINVATDKVLKVVATGEGLAIGLEVTGVALMALDLSDEDVLDLKETIDEYVAKMEGV